MAEIEIRALRKAFDGAEVLKGVDLTIQDGEFISLVGPSGCGKSTLLRVIAGLEPQSSGEVRIDGVSADGVRPSARNLAMVFQSYALYPHLSVFDNIAVPLRMKRLSALERAPFVGRLMPGRRRAERVIRDDVERVAEQLEISPLLKRKPGQLSGGQRQRVAVGRAIVRQPRAFLFDEPLSNLDAKLRVHMRAEIAQLHRQLKTTFIYVTHDQAEAMTMSGRIAVMIGGELIQVGAPAAVYDDPCDIRVAEFVGTPKINAFPGRIRSDGRLEMLGHVLHMATPALEGECRICVRPERIELASHGLLSGTVVHLENLGSEAFVHIGCAGTDAPVVARVNDPSQLPAIGATIGYGFAPEAVRAFDADGKRIVTSLPSRVERPREMAVV
ncbi:ABC transporter ATP-binding protein [Bradyrhizobium retamae]|uniref:Glycerol-3-phosphate ABC transporter ATP-binding protein n=1 Tax=Bradyrhizobium retamae TaxID=1300035 RepID=A0A0R3N1L0_9BRAD|nr:ABC transporter ATP-binding protein [Bradyrhizobium retamae]KRR23430.1 glycerol-3-phosphate ABC transporter ATP-binding protein [Bradyrhizobium retamae]